MKCPYCNEELEICSPMLFCHNCNLFGDKKLFEELAKTKQAFDVAVDALKEYEDRDSYDCNGDWCGCEYSTAHKAIDQIKQTTKIKDE